MKNVDMSSEAITRRLRQASDLRDVSLSLKKARRLTPEEAAELRSRRLSKTPELHETSDTAGNDF